MTEPTPELESLRKAMQKACIKNNKAMRNHEVSVEAEFALRYFFSEDEDEITETDKLISKAMDSLGLLQRDLLKKAAKARKKSDAAHDAYWEAYRAHMASKEGSSDD